MAFAMTAIGFLAVMMCAAFKLYQSRKVAQRRRSRCNHHHHRTYHHNVIFYILNKTGNLILSRILYCSLDFDMPTLQIFKFQNY